MYRNTNPSFHLSLSLLNQHLGIVTATGLVLRLRMVYESSGKKRYIDLAFPKVIFLILDDRLWMGTYISSMERFRPPKICGFQYYCTSCNFYLDDGHNLSIFNVFGGVCWLLMKKCVYYTEGKLCTLWYSAFKNLQLEFRSLLSPFQHWAWSQWNSVLV